METNPPTAPTWSIRDRIDGDRYASTHRLTGLKQTTLVPVALKVSYTDITTRPGIERAKWRTTQLDFFSDSWPVASFWAVVASRGWSGDGVEDMDMAVS